MIALISDIHGHADRLEKVLDDISASKITQIWCLGDIIGAGGRSQRCWQLVREHCKIVLAGNHDLAVCGRTKLEFFPEHGQAGIRDAQNYLLGDEEFEALPVELVTYFYDEPVRLVHGMPGDPAWGFLDGPGEAYFAFQRCAERLIICGHTHKQSLCQGTTFQKGTQLSEVARHELGHERTIINPGAVMFGDWAILHQGSDGMPTAVEFCRSDMS